MPVDKFGRFSFNPDLKRKESCKPWKLGFQLDTDQNFDFNNRRLKNIEEPVEKNDCVNKIYLEKQLLKYSKYTEKEFQNIRNELFTSKSFFEKCLHDEVELCLVTLEALKKNVFHELDIKLKEVKEIKEKK